MHKHGFYVFTSLYTQNEPAVCPLLWFPVAPKLRPMSYQTVRRKACVVQSEKLRRNVILAHSKPSALPLLWDFPIQLKSPHIYSNTDQTMDRCIWAHTTGNPINFTMVPNLSLYPKDNLSYNPAQVCQCPILAPLY